MSGSEFPKPPQVIEDFLQPNIFRSPRTDTELPVFLPSHDIKPTPQFPEPPFPFH